MEVVSLFFYFILFVCEKKKYHFRLIWTQIKVHAILYNQTHCDGIWPKATKVKFEQIEPQIFRLLNKRMRGVKQWWWWWWIKKKFLQKQTTQPKKNMYKSNKCDKNRSIVKKKILHLNSTFYNRLECKLCTSHNTTEAISGIKIRRKKKQNFTSAYTVHENGYQNENQMMIDGWMDIKYNKNKIVIINIIEWKVWMHTHIHTYIHT